MGFFKQLKKRLRWKRLLFPFLGAFALWNATWIAHAAPEASFFYQVTKKTEFICGEETVDLGTMSLEEIERIRKGHPDWDLRFLDRDHALFLVQVEGLSPQCMGHVFFGLDDHDRFTLFEGEPALKRALHTFFQIDTGQLETSLPHETLENLRKGIPIRNMEQYNSVLAAFREFATAGEFH